MTPSRSGRFLRLASVFLLLATVVAGQPAVADIPEAVPRPVQIGLGARRVELLREREGLQKQIAEQNRTEAPANSPAATLLAEKAAHLREAMAGHARRTREFNRDVAAFAAAAAHLHEPVTDAGVVDLRDLVDPTRPVTIDPNVVRGQPRQLPVQIDPATFDNAHYRAGFDALMRFDPKAAVPLFEAAQAERPDDLLVRAGRLLALDLREVRVRREREAAHWVEEVYVSLAAGEPGGALSFALRAAELDPQNVEARALVVTARRVAAGMHDPENAERRNAYRLVGNALAAISIQQPGVASELLAAARLWQPHDPVIAEYATALERLRPRD